MFLGQKLTNLCVCTDPAMIAVNLCFLHFQSSFTFVFLRKFLRLALDDAGLFVGQAVELVNELVDYFPWSGHFYLACRSSFHIIVSSL